MHTNAKQQANKFPLSGSVVVGEASDSEPEDENKELESSTLEQSNTQQSGDNDQNKFTPHSDQQIAKDQSRETSNSKTSCLDRRVSLSEYNFVSDPSLFDKSHQNANKFDSLLHNLLKESNKKLKQNVISSMCTPYTMMQRDIGQLTRSLISTQRHLQSSHSNFHKTTLNQVKQLDSAFDKLDNLLDSN